MTFYLVEMQVSYKNTASSQVSLEEGDQDGEETGNQFLEEQLKEPVLSVWKRDDWKEDVIVVFRNRHKKGCHIDEGMNWRRE